MTVTNGNLTVPSVDFSTERVWTLHKTGTLLSSSWLGLAAVRLVPSTARAICMSQNQSTQAGFMTKAHGEWVWRPVRSCHSISTHLLSFCPYLHFHPAAAMYVVAVSERGLSASSPILDAPVYSCNKCQSSLFCVSGILPDTRWTVNRTDNFPAVKDLILNGRRQSPVQTNKVTLVIVFIIVLLWMYVHQCLEASFQNMWQIRFCYWSRFASNLCEFHIVCYTCKAFWDIFDGREIWCAITQGENAGMFRHASTVACRWPAFLLASDIYSLSAILG